MENEENKAEMPNENEEFNIQSKENRSNKKNCFLFICIICFLIYGLYIFILSRPLKGDDLYCKYKGKYNKIVCTQTGDVVPEWLQLDNNPFLRYLGISDNYSMKLIISHNNKDYIILNMAQKEFITDLNRKFIYELKEQTFRDWLDFKRYTALQGFEYSNWGSVALYCSESNLKDEVCKKIKKQYKK